MPPVGVVRRTCTLGGNHGRTQRMLRIARRAKRWTVMRLLDAAQNFSADARFGFERSDLRDVEQFFRVIVTEFLAQAIPAPRNRADAAPFAVTHFEYFRYQCLCCRISLATQ